MARGGSSRLSCGVRPGKEPSIDWKSRVKEFLAQPEIKVTKQTKRSEKEIDLRPNIYKIGSKREWVLLYAGICKL